MAGIKSLAKDTAVYGLSSILGRFLNWLLVPLYVHIFPTGEYGIVTNLYAATAVALVILNYGMETGFFRFANKEKDSGAVYTTSLMSVGVTSLLFIVLLAVFLNPVAAAMKLPGYNLYIMLMGITVAIDAFTNIPFAYLRFSNRAWRFAGIKLTNIGVNISLNLFFILGCPVLERHCPGAIDWFYTPLGGEGFGIGWIFVANLLSTLTVLVCLLPELAGRRWVFLWPLLKKMLSYSWPLLILGVAGILSQNMGQLIIPWLFPTHQEEAMSMVGIYGANMKIAVVMVMFTQAFRYAYEPFIFAQAKGKGEDRSHAYCEAMKYFVAFGLLIFLGVMFFLPVLKHFIGSSYWSGLDVVPLMMLAELCFGVFFNLSLWYKLTDRTQWGMYFSLTCFVLMFGLNVWLVPMIGIPGGYIGSAWAALISYFIVMALSYFAGQRYYPLPYAKGRMLMYVVVAAALYFLGVWAEEVMPMWAVYCVRSVLLVIYTAIVGIFENVPLLTPLLRRIAGR